MGYNPILGTKKHDVEIDPFSFRAINYHHGDFDLINAMLGEVDWGELKKICDEENDLDGSLFKNLLVLTVLQVTLQHAPQRD